MFNPTQADVRRFFCAVHAKAQAGQPMEAIETLASLWIAEHPEYHAELSDLDAALAAGLPRESLVIATKAGFVVRDSRRVIDTSRGALLDDLQRLPHLREADAEARVAVAAGIENGFGEIGHVRCPCRFGVGEAIIAPSGAHR